LSFSEYLFPFFLRILNIYFRYCQNCTCANYRKIPRPAGYRGTWHILCLCLPTAARPPRVQRKQNLGLAVNFFLDASNSGGGPGGGGGAEVVDQKQRPRYVQSSSQTNRGIAKKRTTLGALVALSKLIVGCHLKKRRESGISPQSPSHEILFN
jgi:hypothetical protein